MRVCTFGASATDCSVESANCRLVVLGQCYASDNGAGMIVSQGNSSSVYTVSFVASCTSGSSNIEGTLTVGASSCFAYGTGSEVCAMMRA